MMQPGMLGNLESDPDIGITIQGMVVARVPYAQVVERVGQSVGDLAKAVSTADACLLYEALAKNLKNELREQLSSILNNLLSSLGANLVASFDLEGSTNWDWPGVSGDALTWNKAGDVTKTAVTMVETAQSTWNVVSSGFGWGAIRTAVANALGLIIKSIIMESFDFMWSVLEEGLRIALGCPAGAPVNPAQTPSAGGGSPGVPASLPPGSPASLPSPRAPVERTYRSQQQSLPMVLGRPRKTDWLTYALWGTAALVAVSVISKLSTGAYVPKQVRETLPATVKNKLPR